MVGAHAKPSTKIAGTDLYHVIGILTICLPGNYWVRNRQGTDWFFCDHVIIPFTTLLGLQSPDEPYRIVISSLFRNSPV